MFISVEFICTFETRATKKYFEYGKNVTSIACRPLAPVISFLVCHHICITLARSKMLQRRKQF
jgi:hypothetical protein